MNAERQTLDVVVVGSGPAGSAVAYMLADAGHQVALLEARPFAEAGPRWVATVVPWAFDRARLPRPEPPERLSTGDRSSLLDAQGRVHLTIEQSPAWSLDLRRLTTRLRDLAERAGARCYDRTVLVEVGLRDGRPVWLETVREDSEGCKHAQVFHAKLFVDATGLGGALARRVPLIARDCPRVPRHHLCSAAQQVCRVEDRSGARAFLARHGAKAGEVLARTGVDGGYSTMWVHVDGDAEHVDLLAGAIADGRHATGPEMLRDFKFRHPWIGQRLSGGSGLIPLRRPYDRLAAPGIALVGDAACQVFPAHGSGVGVGLMAARLLADAAAAADDPGSLRATWAYQAAFHREHGPVLGVYDLFRRFSQSLSEADVARLLASGAVSRVFYEAALVQQIPRPAVRDLAGPLRYALRAPIQSAHLAALLPRMAAVYAIYGRHPVRPDNTRLRRWSAAVARLFGERPDVGAGARGPLAAD